MPKRRNRLPGIDLPELRAVFTVAQERVVPIGTEHGFRRIGKCIGKCNELASIQIDQVAVVMRGAGEVVEPVQRDQEAVWIDEVKPARQALLTIGGRNVRNIDAAAFGQGAGVIPAHGEIIEGQREEAAIGAERTRQRRGIGHDDAVDQAHALRQDHADLASLHATWIGTPHPLLFLDVVQQRHECLKPLAILHQAQRGTASTGPKPLAGLHVAGFGTVGVRLRPLPLLGGRRQSADEAACDQQHHRGQTRLAPHPATNLLHRVERPRPDRKTFHVACQILHQRPDVRIALLRITRQAAQDDRLQIQRQLRPCLARTPHLVFAKQTQGGLGGVGTKRRLARDQVVEDRTKTPDIRGR